MEKLVRVSLAALTRVEWFAVARVPAQFDHDGVTDPFYDKVDGGDFYPDPEYWERGTCQVWPAEEGDVPTHVLDEDGKITELDAPDENATMKVEYLVAFEDRTWDTFVEDVPLEAKNHLDDWADKNLAPRIEREVAMIAVYCIYEEDK
jgi:hypothetical protein